MFALYVVATPIGNLEDITLRALRILSEVGLVAAEDTRKTKRLLSHYAISTPLTSYHEHNKMSKLPLLLDHLQQHDVALVSEAGTPALSDPGYELIMAATEHGIPVIPIPGPSAVLAALVVSALPTDRFSYLGFLPRKQADRIRLLESVKDEKHTLVSFEAPHRLTTALQDMAGILGDRRIAVIREVTKIHEEVFRGTINQAIGYFQQPRGEYTLVIEGKSQAAKPTLTSDLEDQIRSLQGQGLAARQAVRLLAQSTGLPRKELYQAWLRLKKL